MTLDEVIKHCEEVAKEKRYEYQECVAVNDMESAEECGRGGEQHEQLAEWLKELKELRLKDAKIKDAINNCEMKKLAQDEVSSFEHEVLKIYGVME